LFQADGSSTLTDTDQLAKTMRRLRIFVLTASIVGGWCLSSVLHAQGGPQASKPTAKPATAVLQPSEVAEIGLRATVAISGETASGKQVSGAGFLVEPTGVIVTNLHVIEGLKNAIVTLPNGDAYDRVKIRAYDERKDIAVIQIPGFNLPILSLGDSDRVKPGESTMLIGHPLGLTASITAGIVSAIRPVDGFRVFQTDAAASPGNSGGPDCRADTPLSILGIDTTRLMLYSGVMSDFFRLHPPASCCAGVH